MHKIKQQNGAALITALMITAIIAALATLIFMREQINIRETELITNADQLYLYTQGVNDWAINVLISQKKNQPLVKTMQTKYNNAQIQGQLIDAQAKFNINALANPMNQDQFARLISLLQPKISMYQAEAIAHEVNIWLTPSNSDAIYLKMNPPYLAAHRFITHISELRLIKGITAKLYQQLKPYIIALPTAENTININNASAIIIASLANNISLQKAKTIVNYRNNNSFSKADDFDNYLRKLGVDSSKLQAKVITKSSYFLVFAKAASQNQKIKLTSLIYRIQARDNSYKIKTLWQLRN